MESLEDRIALATGDLAMIAATAVNPNVVVAQYQVTGMPLTGPLTLEVYRSADTTLDPSDQLLGLTTLIGPALDPGLQSATIPLAETLDIEPARPYVLVVADRAAEVPESDETNNQAEFRKFVVAAVTHGLELAPFGTFPAWVTELASAVKATGYDVVIPFDWAQLSGLPIADASTRAAQGLFQQVGDAVLQLIAGATPGVPAFTPGDVIDVHLIGHSRGGGVVSQAMRFLGVPGPQPLIGGYQKLSLLDPHPARNGPLPFFSASSGPLGQLIATNFVTFQAGADDPPVTIPQRVNRAEIFFQHTLATNAATPDEMFLNSWGEVPVGGAPAVYYDLSSTVRSHTGVHVFYLQAVVPTLATGAAVPVDPVPTPAPPTTGGLTPARGGGRYELRLLGAAGIATRDSVPLLQGIDHLNRLLARNAFRAADRQLTRLERFVGLRSGRTIPTASADSLFGVFQITRALRLGQTPSGSASPARFEQVAQQ